MDAPFVNGLKTSVVTLQCKSFECGRSHRRISIVYWKYSLERVAEGGVELDRKETTEHGKHGNIR